MNPQKAFNLISARLSHDALGMPQRRSRSGAAIRRKGFCLLFQPLLLFVISSVPMQAQDRESMENGLVRLSFDTRTGLFEAYSLSGEMRLFDAGPTLQVDGHVVTSRDATKITVRRGEFTDSIGAGKKLVVLYRFKDKLPDLRYELSLYADKPWVTATAFLSKGSYEMGDCSVVKGKLRVQSAFDARVYVSTGRAGGSGVYNLGMRSLMSSTLSVVYEPKTQEAIGLGFYSLHRASSSLNVRYLKRDEVEVAATSHYRGYKPEEEDLRTESLLVNLGRTPLNMLDEWAELTVKVVKPRFNHDVGSGLLNPWYIYGNETSEDRELRQTRLLAQSVLPSYGIKYVIAGEWQKQRNEPGDVANALGFGEDEEDSKLFPHGLKWVCEQIAALGFRPAYGFNYAYAASESSTYKNNPSWVMKEDRHAIGLGYPIDYTNPAAQQWLWNLSHRVFDLKAGWLWTDFNGGPAKGPLYNTKEIVGFEDVRDGLRNIRMGAGPDVLREFVCCGPYFTAIGLVDRVRTSDDTHPLGDWEGLKSTARSLAAMYMAHQRFWITDADPIFVGAGAGVYNPGETERIAGDPAIQEEVRMRLQVLLSAGSFLTVGENLEDMDAQRMRLLTLALPTYGEAARPLDLFVSPTPEIYDLKVKAAWDQWHVLMLQNWNDNEKAYDIDFSNMGMDANRSYVVFRFWDQTFLGTFRDHVSLHVGAREGESFVIREAPKHPWVLSTDMHLTQGAMELKDVGFEESSGRLQGIAQRHRGANGHVVLYVPNEYQVRSASGPYVEDPPISNGHTVHLLLNFAEDRAEWWLATEKSPPGEPNSIKEPK